MHKWLAIIGLFVLVGITSGQNPPTNAPKAGITKSDGGSEGQKKPDSQPSNEPTPPAVTACPQPTTPTCDESCQQGRENLKIQNRIVWLTGGLVAVGLLQVGSMILQAVLLFGTLKAIKRQGDAMEISERAWLLIEPRRPNQRRVDKDGVAEFFWIVKNVGNTPATLIDTQARFEVIGNDDLTETPDYGELMPLNERTLAPGGSLKFHTKWTERQNGRHVLYVLQEGADEIVMVCGYGRIGYRNTFGQYCESRFCSNVFLRGNEFRVGFLPNFDAPPVYTKHT